MKLEKFLNIIEDQTSLYYKIPKENYLKEGGFPVIDQGKNFIAGYTNDKNKIVLTTVPSIIFGDHTRILKYVDFPFTIGADGVKVLQVNLDKAYPRYIYYYLSSIELPDAGYSRHYKYLKDIKIPIPDQLEDQIKIAHLLSHTENLIAQRQESITLLDEYLRGVFLEMFGTPIINNKDWESYKLGTFIQIKHGYAFKSEYFSTKGNYLLLTPGNFHEKGGYKERGENQKFYNGSIPEEYILKKNDLLVAMTEQAPGLLGSPIIVPDNNIFLHNQRLGKVKFDTVKFNEYFLFYFFANPVIKDVIHKRATGTKVRHTSPSKIEDLPLFHPPFDLQKKFAAIVEKTEALKQQLHQSLRELEMLFASLSQRAFKGELALGKLKVTYEEEYSATDNDRTEPKPIDWKKISVAKKPISEMSLDDYYGIPEEVQQEHGSIEQHEFDWEFFFKKHFLDRPVTSDVVQDLYTKYNFERGLDFSFDEFTNIVFTELQKENSYLKQIFSKDDKKIELRIAP